MRDYEDIDFDTDMRPYRDSGVSAYREDQAEDEIPWNWDQPELDDDFADADAEGLDAEFRGLGHPFEDSDHDGGADGYYDRG